MILYIYIYITTILGEIKKRIDLKNIYTLFLLSILERSMNVPNIINGWGGAFRGY